MRYTITALVNDQPLSVTRTISASALVVAQKWIAAGYDEVRIVAADGTSLTADAFRERFARIEHRWTYRNGRVPPLSLG